MIAIDKTQVSIFIPWGDGETRNINSVSIEKVNEDVQATVLTFKRCADIKFTSSSDSWKFDFKPYMKLPCGFKYYMSF